MSRPDHNGARFAIGEGLRGTDEPSPPDDEECRTCVRRAHIHDQCEGDQERRQYDYSSSSHRRASYTAPRRDSGRLLFSNVRMKRLIIAIDGPSGAGKGTVSRALAQTLG